MAILVARMPCLRSLMLEENVIHIWRATLDLPSSGFQDLQRTLSIDEYARADRFRHHRDRNRFIVARGLLRVILASYLQRDPSRLRFRYGPHGKPALNMKSTGEAPSFNLAHSDGIALYAVTRGRELGVDLERIRPDRADTEVAKHFCSPMEMAALRALPKDRRPEAFFACWTRKEAYIKARGGGLSISLKQFSVAISGEESPVLLHHDGNHSERSRWSLLGLNLYQGWAAALAVEGRDWRADVNAPATAAPTLARGIDPSSGLVGAYSNVSMLMTVKRVHHRYCHVTRELLH